MANESQPEFDDTLIENMLANANIEDAEIVKAVPKGPNVSLRLSEPLLQRLDEIAAGQHRTRSNLIQHVLWAYVRWERNP